MKKEEKKVVISKKAVKREIRNRESTKKVKPRVFDVCYYPDDGKTYLEVKGKNRKVERINFDDVLAQINETKMQYRAAE